MQAKKKQIGNDLQASLHPSLQVESGYWRKWRLTMEGGRAFVDAYLEKFTSREDSTDFATRKKVTYCPARAKAALTEIKNSIFQRMSDIRRDGGPESWQVAVRGDDGGVDLTGNSMNGFIGREIIKELLGMRRVGIYVDKPRIPQGATLAETRGLRPYLYTFTAENIRNWQYNDQNELTSLLLREYVYDYDNFGLATEARCRYRLLTLSGGKVVVRYFSEVGDELDHMGPVTLDIPQIPFVELEISDSLLADVADHQVALLNMASSDVQYCLLSNFPFYTEQYSPLAELANIRPPAPAGEDANGVANPENTGEAAENKLARDPSIKVGASHGRNYPDGMERPAFIHPSAEPLQASMEKQSEMATEIKQLVNLAVRSTYSKHTDAQDRTEPEDRDLEAGLAAIGMELEYAENRIATIWGAYERDSTPHTVTYPQSYRLLTSKERNEEIAAKAELLPIIPSIVFQQEMAKQIADLALGHAITSDKLKEIFMQIDKAIVVVTDPAVITGDVEAGLLSADTGSLARLYPQGEAKKAQKERALRAAITLAHQQGAGSRGLEDMDQNQKESAKAEKEASQSPDANLDPGKAVRGKGK